MQLKPYPLHTLGLPSGEAEADGGADSEAEPPSGLDGAAEMDEADTAAGAASALVNGVTAAAVAADDAEADAAAKPGTPAPACRALLRVAAAAAAGKQCWARLGLEDAYTCARCWRSSCSHQHRFHPAA